MKTHELKIIPEWFAAVLLKMKTCEIRLNDRDYKVGDELILKEYNGVFTGKKITCVITHILSGWGLKKGYVAISFVILKFR